MAQFKGHMASYGEDFSWQGRHASYLESDDRKTLYLEV